MTRRILLLAALALAACSGPPERWARVEFQDITYQNVYLAVVDLLGSEGYKVTRADNADGQLETEWYYGYSVRELRGPSRRQARVVIEPRDAGGYVVRLRVPEEVIRKGGLLATRLDDSDDWEPYKDNFEEAEYLAAKLRALLIDHMVEVETPRAPPGS